LSGNEEQNNLFKCFHSYCSSTALNNLNTCLSESYGITSRLQYGAIFCTVYKSKLCIIFNPYYINIMIEKCCLLLLSLLIIQNLIDSYAEN